MTARRGDAHRMLLRALRRHYPALEIVESSSKLWASVTFTGKRHRIVCRSEEPLLNLATDITEAEFQLPGHIVADISVHSITALGDGWTIVVEALSVENA